MTSTDQGKTVLKHTEEVAVHNSAEAHACRAVLTTHAVDLAGHLRSSILHACTAGFGAYCVYFRSLHMLNYYLGNNFTRETKVLRSSSRCRRLRLPGRILQPTTRHKQQDGPLHYTTVSPASGPLMVMQQSTKTPTLS